MSVQDLLAQSLDDLKDMPSNKPFPNGTHRVTIDWDIREVSEKETLIQKLTAVETIELSEGEDTPLAAGDSIDILYGDNEYAEGSLKEVLKPLAAATGLTSVMDIIEASKGMEVVVTTKKRAGKRPADGSEARVYTGIVSLIVA
jgi:hypothetical protein